MSLSVASSTFSTSEVISEALDTAVTKGTAPFSQLDMEALYPKVEKPSATNPSNQLDTTDVKVWNGSIDDTYYWNSNPNDDVTPSNLKDNASWCNSYIWEYSGIPIDSPIRTNPGTTYTRGFKDFVEIYPFAEISGNEYLYCAYSIFEENNGKHSTIPEDAQNDISLFYMIEAKMNVSVSIKGEVYNMQISALPDPNSNNSFVMNDDFYYINNYFASDGGDVNDFEDNKIYMLEGLPKKLGIGINDTLNLSSKTKTKTDTYEIKVANYGWNPEYIYLDDMFFNADGNAYTLDLSPGDSNLLVGFVTPETFTDIAKKIYTDNEISKNDQTIDSDGEVSGKVNNNLFDYTLNISDINLIDAYEKGIYDGSNKFDLAYQNSNDPSNKWQGNSDFRVRTAGGILYAPSLIKIDDIRYNKFNFFSRNIDNTGNIEKIWATNDRGAYSPQYVELAHVNDQADFFNILSQTVLVTLIIITILVSIFIVYKICSYFRKKIGVLKSQGFNTTSIVLGMNFSIAITIIASLLVSIAFIPAFSIMWASLANQSLVITIPLFDLSFRTFYTLIMLPSILLLLSSSLFTYILTSPNSLKLMNDVKVSKPSLAGRALDKLEISKHSFINSYVIKNLFNNFFKSFSMILIVSSFSIFILLSLSANDLTESTVESISSQMKMNYASINNTKFQKSSYEYDEVFDDKGNPKNGFQEVDLNIDTSKQIDLFTPSEYASCISQVKSSLEKVQYNGHQLFLVDELSYLDDLIRFASQKYNSDPSWSSIDSSSLVYNNKLSTLGIHETNNKYLSLGFDVNDGSQANFRVVSEVTSSEWNAFEPYIEDKLDTSEVLPNPDNNVVIPDQIPNTGGGSSTSPPNVSYESLFSLSLISYSYSKYELEIDYSKASMQNLVIDHVNLDNVVYDSTNTVAWNDDKSKERIIIIFDNLSPETTYNYSFTFKDDKSNLYQSSSYRFTTGSKEFATATGNHYIPGPIENRTFATTTTNYCTYSGPVPVEPTDGSFYIPFDSTTQNCVYDTKGGFSKDLSSVMLINSNDMNSYVNMSEVNPDFDYKGYINEVNKSDGKIPILVPNSSSKLDVGDTFKGMDFSSHGKDIFAPDATSFAIDSDFYVYDSINVPVSYFGSLVPINDPDFVNNQSYNETTNKLESSSNLPVNANNGNMVFRSFLTESSDGLISKSEGIGDSFSTLSVGIRVKKYNGTEYVNSNLFNNALSFNLYELVSGSSTSGSPSTPDYKFDVNNSDKIISNDNYDKVNKIVYAISQMNISLSNVGNIILAINSLDFNSLTIPGDSTGPSSVLVDPSGRPADKNKFTADGAIYQNQIIDWYNDYMYYAMINIQPNVQKLDYVKEGERLGDNLPYTLENAPKIPGLPIEELIEWFIANRMVNNVDFVNEFYESVYWYQNDPTKYTQVNPINKIFNAESMAGRTSTKALIGRLLNIELLANIQAFNGSYNELVSTSFLKTDNIGISLESLLYKVTEPSLSQRQELINALLILGLILSVALLLVMLSIYTTGSKKEINILKSIGWNSKSVFIANSYNIIVYAFSILIAFLVSGYVLKLISSGLGYVAGTFPVSILLSFAAIISLLIIIALILVGTFAYNIYNYNTTKIDRESII